MALHTLSAPRAGSDGLPAPTPRGIELLSPLETPLNELETRITWLVEYLGDRDATLPPEVLHLFLLDIRDNCADALKCWSEAWTAAGGVA